MKKDDDGSDGELGQSRTDRRLELFPSLLPLINAVVHHVTPEEMSR